MSSLKELKTYFDTDDGYLPDVSVSGYDSKEVPQVFNRLINMSSPSSLESELWHLPTEANVKLSNFDCAAELVVRGEAEPFHMMLKKPMYLGVELPDLGAFIFQENITLDYRRGPEWSYRILATFLTFINTVMLLKPSITVEHEECANLFNKCLAEAV